MTAQIDMTAQRSHRCAIVLMRSAARRVLLELEAVIGVRRSVAQCEPRRRERGAEHRRRTCRWEVSAVNRKFPLRECPPSDRRANDFLLRELEAS